MPLINLKPIGESRPKRMPEEKGEPREEWKEPLKVISVGRLYQELKELTVQDGGTWRVESVLEIIRRLSHEQK